MQSKFVRKTVTKESSSPISAMLKGVGLGYLLTIAIFIVYAVLITYTGVSEKNVQAIVLVTVVLSVVIAGFKSARAAESKGWLWGIFAGLLYVVIMIFIGFCFVADFGFGTKGITLLILSAAGGGLGGVIGINKK